MTENATDDPAQPPSRQCPFLSKSDTTGNDICMSPAGGGVNIAPPYVASYCLGNYSACKMYLQGKARARTPAPSSVDKPEPPQDTVALPPRSAPPSRPARDQLSSRSEQEPPAFSDRAAPGPAGRTPDTRREAPPRSTQPPPGLRDEAPPRSTEPPPAVRDEARTRSAEPLPPPRGPESRGGVERIPAEQRRPEPVQQEEAHEVPVSTAGQAQEPPPPPQAAPPPTTVNPVRPRATPRKMRPLAIPEVRQHQPESSVPELSEIASPSPAAEAEMVREAKPEVRGISNGRAGENAQDNPRDLPRKPVVEEERSQPSSSGSAQQADAPHPGVASPPVRRPRSEIELIEVTRPEVHRLDPRDVEVVPDTRPDEVTQIVDASPALGAPDAQVPHERQRASEREKSVAAQRPEEQIKSSREAATAHRIVEPGAFPVDARRFGARSLSRASELFEHPTLWIVLAACVILLSGVTYFIVLRAGASHNTGVGQPHRRTVPGPAPHWRFSALAVSPDQVYLMVANPNRTAVQVQFRLQGASRVADQVRVPARAQALLSFPGRSRSSGLTITASGPVLPQRLVIRHMRPYRAFGQAVRAG